MERYTGDPRAQTDGASLTRSGGQLSVPLKLREPSKSANDLSKQVSVAICASFTIDSLRSPLTFWLNRIGIRGTLTCAPYAQVMQELLNPKSSLSLNSDGVNVLLVRLEDWIRNRLATESIERNVKKLEASTSEFLSAVDFLMDKTGTPLLVFVCPSSVSLPDGYKEAIEANERGVLANLESRANIYTCTHGELSRLYGVVEYEDPQTDRIAHIPYTNEYFVAIATFIARRITLFFNPPFKVIITDCDNTLWKGICGEDGPSGVALTPAHLRFQKMLARQNEIGRLLCLCSKNNASDVNEVFETRTEMPLKQEIFVGQRINWKAKSENILSLAEELGLSLDSFIFIDDDPVECAEVQTHCPSVLALLIPKEEAEIERFLDHIWAFDYAVVTDEAKRRAEKYKENRTRELARDNAPDLETFLASLELQIEVSLIKPEQMLRTEELVQRTNQFNMTSIRRRLSEIELLWNSGQLEILVVCVSDRFGDYGLVGAAFFSMSPSSLDVDTFLLSCRALGRGVEHRMVHTLGLIARSNGLRCVVIRYEPTKRNVISLEFLQRYFSSFGARSENEGRFIFSIPTEIAEGVRTDSLYLEYGGAHGKEIEPRAQESGSAASASIRGYSDALKLNRIIDIVTEIRRVEAGGRSSLAGTIQPRNETEDVLSKIWADVLGIEKIGVDSDFFSLGGNSLQAVRTIARIESVLGVELAVTSMFEATTIEQLAVMVAAESDSISGQTPS